MKIVIDCSTFLSGALFPRGNPHQVLKIWTDQELELVISDVIYQEYKNKLVIVAKKMFKIKDNLGVNLVHLPGVLG